MKGHNSAKFNWDVKTVPISEIDITDDACHLGLSVDATDLVSSVEAVGLINPPILKHRQEQKYQIVCGFRRVLACKTLGWDKIESCVLSEKLADFDLLRLAVLDNRSHRQLNVVEQARGISKLAPHVPPRDRLRLLSSLLGFPENRKVFEKLEALSGLPEPIQGGVVEETISFEGAVFLARLSPEDASSCFHMLKPLRLSQNKQTEIITWVQEIAIREDIQPEELIRSEDVRTILENPDLNRNERSSKLRAYLRKRRFPNLAQAEEKFSREAGTLKLDEHVHLSPPPHFEGGSYSLRMTFKTLEDFNKRLNALTDIAKNPALKRLLKPFH